MRLGEPMLPETTWAEFMPMPMSMGFWPTAARWALNTESWRIMAMAQRRARSSSSSCGSGVPNTAMMASPMNLSSMPPSACRQSTMRVK